MKRQHNAQLPPWHEPRPVVLSDEYQREVDRSTDKLERRFWRAERRAEHAERRLAVARDGRKRKVSRRTLIDLEALVQARRAELDEVRRLMVGTPAGASHRGTDSFRPVPVTHEVGP